MSMAFLAWFSLAAGTATAGPHLAIDPSAVPMTYGMHVRLGPVKKDAASPLFGEDRPFDVAWWNTYPTIAYDPNASIYKLWYNGCGDCSCAEGVDWCTVAAPFGPTTPTKLANNGMCPHLGYNYTEMQFGGSNVTVTSVTYYAESTDGISWVKPELGLVEFAGSKNNNIVLNTNTDPNRGVFFDEHETNASRRFKMIGNFVGTQKTGMRRGGVATWVSADGIHWDGLQSANSMQVAGDTANNALYDPNLKKYIAFSRNHCRNSACNESGWGNRRETWSTSDTWGTDNWTKATEALHGEHGYEIYSLVPFRAPTWTPGLYLAVGSFFEDTNPEGYVKCELCRSVDYGKTWTRLAPHMQFIPLGDTGSFDSHTCYAAPPILDPKDPKTTLLYYAGGNGPHSGHGVEHGRANFMARASAPTDGFAGLTPDGSVGLLRTRRLTLTGKQLRLRIAGDATAAVTVRVMGSAGGLLLLGVARPAQSESAMGTSELVDVVFSGDAEAVFAELQGESVVLEMELLGASLFSFEFVDGTDFYPLFFV
eukprot:TRINITY_DN48359_c0_g1_i1.p1 TRINITY_DN48359_c0_g1~~TRINITY_DN48359_c0_g1_i1.p1  ORF type:complete len:537 (-),score=48.44 TRINITY_DN48359_c0_g1_i1:127-1737(-)